MMTLNISTEDIKRLAAKLSKPERDKALKIGMQDSGNLLKNWIMNNRLSGPRPEFLGVVSNRLRSSIGNAHKADGIWDYNKDTYTLKIGTNVEYAAVHEFGVGTPQQGSVVRGHLRRDKSKDEYIKTYVGGKLKRTRVVTGAQGIGSHLRFWSVRARPFMSASIEDRDNQTNILRLITLALQTALDKE
jgi:phage gpG-like protein